MLFVCMMRAGCCEQSAVCCVQCAVCNDRGEHTHTDTHTHTYTHLRSHFGSSLLPSRLEQVTRRLLASSVVSSLRAQPFRPSPWQCMVVGQPCPDPARCSEPVPRDQRRLIEHNCDEVLQRGFLIPTDSNKFGCTCITARHLWYTWVRGCASITLRRFAANHKEATRE